jgi:hypothetical protein
MTGGLPGVLFVVFLVLKLVGVIDWSWWWVTSPLWLLALVAFAVGFAMLYKAQKIQWRNR